MISSKKLAVVLCVAVLVASGARAEDLEAGKALGQSLGASGAQQAPGVTESATVLNDTMGHESTQGAGSGSGHDRGYTGAATYTSKLACAEGRTKFFGGFGLKVASCTLAGERVSLIGLSFCTSARDGAVCQWSAPSNVLNPGSTTFGDFTVNVSCPDGGTICDVSVREAVSQVWNADTVAEEGRQAAQAEGEGGFYDSLNTTYNDGNYRASLSAVGPQYSGCVEQVDTGLASDGIVYSCDGRQSASFDAACEETRECVREAQQITRYDVDCVSGVDLVEQTCTTVTPTKDCEVSIEKQTYSCNKTLTVTVSRTGAPTCQQGQWVYAGSVTTGSVVRSAAVDYYCDLNTETIQLRFIITSKFGVTTVFTGSLPRAFFQITPAQSLQKYGTQTRGVFAHNGEWAGIGFSSGAQGCGAVTCSYTFAFTDATSYSWPLQETHPAGFPLYKALFSYNVTSPLISVSFPAPATNYTYAYEDIWADGCATYENSK